MRAFVNSSLALHSYFALYHNLRNSPPLGLSHFPPDKFSISAYLPLSLMMILSKKHACPRLHLNQTFTPRYSRHSRTAFRITCLCARGLYPSECSFFTRASAHFRERNLVGKSDTIWSDGNFERQKYLVGRRAKRTLGYGNVQRDSHS